MFNNRNSSIQATKTSKGGSDNKTTMGVVYAVVLDIDDDILKDLEIPEGERSKYIGSIQYRLQNSTTKSDEYLPLAVPYNKNYTSLPVKNELVRMIDVEGNGMMYERVTPSPTPNIGSSETTITNTFSKDKNQQKKASSYSTVQQTGIARSNADSSTEYDGYGKYFEKNSNIHKLKLYEGDTLIESRFGQSIRFSAYNNANNEFSPTLILRNSESGESLKKTFGESTEEDVNRDGTMIVLGSNQYKLPFQPGTVDDKGSTDFETSPNTFRDYPSELLGDQLLLNSGRVIISSKNAEMIFYSKKNYGFISDGWLSIDNKFGIEANVGDNINVTTNDKSINLNTGNGNINLGNQSLESLVRGETLVDLLTQLIDAISQQIYLTPAGPSSPGPTNVAVFNKIKSQLRTMLSDLNKTS